MINNQTLKCSIITVNLNNSTGLEKTILSVVEQSFKAFEFIIIDGGSVDSSIDVIKKYQNTIDYWVSEPDNGIYHAMNKGIKQAKGEYCFFLNSGDLFTNELTLQNVFTNNNNQAEIIYGNVLLKKGDKEWIQKHPKNLTFKNFYTTGICHQASFIKRQLFAKHGYYNESFKIVSDWEFFINAIILSNATTQYIDQTISIFNIEGFGYQNSELMEAERQNVLHRKIPELILKDYDFYKNHFDDFESLVRMKKNKFAYFIFRTLNKIT